MVEKIRLGMSERKVNKMSEIALYIGPAALFEQTAEECVELSKACLKTVSYTHLTLPTKA